MLSTTVCDVPARSFIKISFNIMENVYINLLNFLIKNNNILINYYYIF